jgi:hypothetical protein
LAVHNHSLAKPLLSDILKDARLPQDGAMDGYQMTQIWVNSRVFRIVGDPLPGITGSESCSIEARSNGRTWTSRDPVGVPIPGADEAREAMFRRVLHIGARTAANVVALLPYVEQDNLYRQLTPETADLESNSGRQAMNFLLGDGSVRFLNVGVLDAKLQNYDVGGMKILAPFWEQVKGEMRLGALREDWRGKGEIEIESFSWGATQGAINLYNFSGLEAVTQSAVIDEELEAKLHDLVNRARAAAAAGNEVAMEELLLEYEKIVAGNQDPGKVLETDGAIAMSIARALREASGAPPVR